MITAQKMKFSITDFFSRCDQIRSILRIWSHLLKKPVIENFIFCSADFFKWIILTVKWIILYRAETGLAHKQKTKIASIIILFCHGGTKFAATL